MKVGYIIKGELATKNGELRSWDVAISTSYKKARIEIDHLMGTLDQVKSEVVLLGGKISAEEIDGNSWFTKLFALDDFRDNLKDIGMENLFSQSEKYSLLYYLVEIDCLN